MKQLVEYTMDGGGSILVEVDLPEAGFERVGRSDEIVKAAKSFDDALDQIKPIAQKIINKLRSLSDAPDEIGVQFGLKLGAKAGAIIASAEAEANFTVTLSWKREMIPTPTTS